MSEKQKKKLTELLNEIVELEHESKKEIQTLSKNGLMNSFGCGHSTGELFMIEWFKERLTDILFVPPELN